MWVLRSGWPIIAHNALLRLAAADHNALWLRSLVATMDDIQLVASVAAGDLLALWDSVSECAAFLLLN
jgi:hypothetical protein